MRRSHLVFAFFLGLLAIFSVSDLLAAESTALADLGRMRIEELMEIDVTTAAKKSQRLSGVSAAAFVLSGEDIRRSGATSIPDALRMAPGVEVARISSTAWAISVRGFSGRFANKLLVMIDGRSVYTPLFSGVYWDALDTPLEDVERIEVIRGPGGTLWGANAVNGVINIITKSADKTQGALVSVGAGTLEKTFATLRYGSQLGDGVYYRIYGKGFKRDNLLADGEDVPEDWESHRLGFRLDAGGAHGDRFSLQGDWYRLDEKNEIVSPEVLIEEDQVDGGHLLGRWEHDVSADSELMVQAYYDRSVRHEFTRNQTLDIYNVEMQHRWQMTATQELLWGGSVQYSEAAIETADDSASRSDRLWSGFFQDELVLFPERFRLIFGTKIEKNDFTGTEIMPNSRLLWTPDSRQTYWLAVSRAVRTPAQATSGTQKSAGAPAVSLVVLENLDLSTEILWAYEMGYRHQLEDWLYYDLSLFYNQYDDLLYAQKSSSSMAGTTTTLITYENDLFGTTWGGEFLLEAKLNHSWRSSISYSYLRMDLDSDSSEGLVRALQYEENSPNQQVKFRSFVTLPSQIELDTLVNYLRYPAAAELSSVITVDVRLGFRPIPSLELSLVGQNLFDARHPEFLSKEGVTQEVPRSIYGKLAWMF